jgi:hypothetical protein
LPQVSQEYAVDVLPANPDLGRALQRTSAGVEKELLRRCFDQKMGQSSTAAAYNSESTCEVTKQSGLLCLPDLDRNASLDANAVLEKLRTR